MIGTVSCSWSAGKPGRRPMPHACREDFSVRFVRATGRPRVTDVAGFGLTIAVVGLAGLFAVASNRFSEWIRVPAPAVFLIVAAVVSDLVPVLGRVPVIAVQRVVTVMLILLLFDGGMHIGWRRFRSA